MDVRLPFLAATDAARFVHARRGTARCDLSGRGLVAALCVLFCGSAQAAILTVGAPDSGCNHTTIQAAVAAAAAAGSPGPDTIRIARSSTWTAQQISTQTDQDLDLIGGYPDCAAAEPSGEKTTLSGAGGDARPVLTLRGNGVFRLRGLILRDGDQAGDDDGGGIYFEGGGILDIENSTITENAAEDGGGIYAVGTSIQSELILGADVIVSFNTARKSGGGVVAKSLEMSLRGPNSALMFNQALGIGGGGNGGGLTVVSEAFKSYAYISSNGIGGIGAVYANEAVNGGGIAAVVPESTPLDAVVQIFSTDSAHPVRINGNTASLRGGALYLEPDGDKGSLDGYAVALLHNVEIEQNTAPDGAAVLLAHDNYGVGGAAAVGGRLYFNVAANVPNVPLHPDAAPCPFGKPCGAIRRNTTGNTTGAIVHFAEDAYFAGSKIVLQDNEGGYLMRLTGEEATQLDLDNSLLSGNTVANALIRDDQDQDYDIPFVSLHYLTIAGNTIGGAAVLDINEDLLFTRSIVDQPDKETLAATGPAPDIQHVLVNEPSNPAGTTLGVGRFVDPANGDYSLRAGSLAVDFAPPLTPFLADLYSHTRTIDLALAPNEGGPSDVGALEREYVQPLVLNPGFDTDLNLWDILATSDWDGTQNVWGGTSSGSLRGTLAADDVRVAMRKQCIHLPGPGTYALNGWGRVSGSGGFPNRVFLDWEFRRNAGYNGCSGGAPDATGSLQLAEGTTWSNPAVPALIDIGPALWGNHASLTVYAVIQNGDPIGRGAATPNAPLGGPQGWFDGITLSTEYDDTIFADGFEIP